MSKHIDKQTTASPRVGAETNKILVKEAQGGEAPCSLKRAQALNPEYFGLAPPKPDAKVE